MTGLPPWLEQAIATRTGLDPRQPRAARAATCPVCRAPVLRGPDDDRCALTAHTDPHRLTPLGELAALIAGRPTYQLRGKPPALEWRTPERIRFAPASLTTTVLAQHECGAPPLDAYPHDTTAPTRKRGKARVNDPAPF